MERHWTLMTNSGGRALDGGELYILQVRERTQHGQRVQSLFVNAMLVFSGKIKD